MTHTSHLSALVIIASFLSAHPGQARAADFDESAVLQAVDKVVAEHRIYTTCLSLEPTLYRIVQENWSREVRLGSEALRDLKPSLAFAARFAAAVSPARLIDESMSLSAAMVYCHKNAAQVMKFHEFGFSHLADAIYNASKSKTK